MVSDTTAPRVNELVERPPLEIVALAAWLNVRPHQLPPDLRAVNCEATTKAWKRVADAMAEAHIEICEAPTVDREAIERLEAERAYLLDRSSEAGRCRFGGKRWTGMSSNAISCVAFGQPDPGDLPHDSSDLAACYQTLKRLPKHLLTETVEKRLAKAEAFVEDRYAGSVAEASAYAEWSGFAALLHPIKNTEGDRT